MTLFGIAPAARRTSPTELEALQLKSALALKTILFSYVMLSLRCTCTAHRLGQFFGCLAAALFLASLWTHKE